MGGDYVAEIITYTGQGAVLGGVYGAIRLAAMNPPTPKPADKVQLEAPPKINWPRIVVRAVGKEALIMAAIAGAYATVKHSAATFRNKEDPWNSALGGAVVGLTMGVGAQPRHAAAGALGVGLFMGGLSLGLGGNDDFALDRARHEARRIGERTIEDMYE